MPSPARDEGARGYVLGNYAASALVLLGVWAFALRDHVGVPRARVALAPLLRYGGPTIAADSAVFLLNVVDRTYLLRAESPAAAGLYSVAVKLATGVIVAVRGFQLAWPPLAYSIEDDDQAREALGRAVKAPADATHHGVEYQRSADGKRAATVIDHLAVFGSETDVKRTIDASKSTALGATDAYTRATAKLPGDALATGYLDLRSVIDGAGKAAGQGAASGIFSSILGKNVAGVGLGIAVMFAAVSFFLDFFGFAGGAVI